MFYVMNIFNLIFYNFIFLTKKKNETKNSKI